MVLCKKYLRSAVYLFVFALAGFSRAETLPVAIPMKYYVSENRQKFIALSAYSSRITYRKASYGEAEIDFGVRYRDAIKNWRIEELPAHGRLFDGTRLIDQAPYETGDPDNLLYVPDSLFTGEDAFFFSVEDDNGTSPMVRVLLIVEGEISLPPGMAEPPDIFYEPVPLPLKSGDSESDDWYIDNSHPLATDDPAAGESDPRHGTPDRPRKTLPPSGTEFPPGSHIFIRGGVETPYALRSGVTWHRWVLKGGTDKPVHITGVVNGADKPRIKMGDSHLRLEMQYSVIEGIHFEGSIVQKNQLNVVSGEHILMRHNIIDGMHKGTSGASLALNQGDVKILYDMHIRNAGRTEPDLSDENDVHGLQISNVENYWILDGVIHDNAGDAIQINGESARYLYIARNKLHSDNENALDFKRREDLFFVENDVWDYRAISYASSGSDGTPVIINQDTNGQTPTRSIIARNRIWDTNNGVRHQGQYIWTIDNLFWHIHHNSNSDNPSFAIMVGNNAESDYIDRIANNTMHRVDGGIWIWAGANSGLLDHQYTGNIFGGLNPDSRDPRHLRISSNHIAGVRTSHNLYMEPANILWGNTEHTLESYRAATSNGAGSMEDRDPLFKDGTGFDLRPGENSPVVGANKEPAAYAEIEEYYGVSPRLDIDGRPRPTDGNWSMGAHEGQQTLAVSSGKTRRPFSSLVLYPNPARGKIFFDMEEALQSYRIYDINGRRILFGNSKNNERIDIGMLAPGVYFLEIKVRDGLRRARFIKQ